MDNIDLKYVIVKYYCGSDKSEDCVVNNTVYSDFADVHEEVLCTMKVNKNFVKALIFSPMFEFEVENNKLIGRKYEEEEYEEEEMEEGQ